MSMLTRLPMLVGLSVVHAAHRIVSPPIFVRGGDGTMSYLYHVFPLASIDSRVPESIYEAKFCPEGCYDRYLRPLY